MVISFVGSSNVSNGLANGTSAVVSRPGGVLDGDNLLVFISIGTVGAIGVPAGWVEVPLIIQTAPNLQNRAYRKVAASEPVSWTWTFASSAYVGICHATRGVSHVYAAQQSDDGLSLLSHSTPVLPAPAGAWLVSSWTGRSLLALGWSAPAGDTERQDVIGGLLILLNVNHAVDDTAAAVVAGNYSKTAATLLAVRALCALVVLAPVLDPIQGSPIDGKVSVLDGVLERGIVGSEIDLFATIDDPVTGPPGLLWTAVDLVHHFDLAALEPGDVVLHGEPVFGSQGFGEHAITPGGVEIQGIAFPGVVSLGAPDIIAGEVVIEGEPVNSQLIFGDAAVMLGFLLSPEPVDASFAVDDFLLGRVVGPTVIPFITPDPNAVNAVTAVGKPMVYLMPSGNGPCCPS